jgi:hypothetical protein
VNIAQRSISVTKGFTIGEDQNTAKLTHAERNDLVERIRGGELREVLMETGERALGASFS